MRRTILFTLFALLAVSAANHANPQRRGRAGPLFARGGHGSNHSRGFSPYGYGYGYLPPDDSGAAYADLPQPGPLVQQPPVFVPPPAPPVAGPQGRPVVTEYKWPSASAPSTASEPETPDFTIVRKDGSTLSAVAVYASDDGLHYVDPDQRHRLISMSDVDRAATLKLNRARNLNLYLPAPQ